MTENFENNNRNRTIKELKAEAKNRGHTGYSKLNKAQLIDLVNHLNEPEPEINVHILTPKPVKKMERVKQYAAYKIATVKNTQSISLINLSTGYLNMSHQNLK